jgi:hypothetical protein
MGRGKTRVLVPMLILDGLSSNAITRVNILPQIVQEATEYYRLTLTASIQHVRLFLFPFQRDLALDETIASQISDEIGRCRTLNACIIATPQHRNSLLLKQHDVDVKVEGLLAYRFLEVLDESDAILDHQFQLVYALGSQFPLPDGASRWNMFLALLVLLARGDDDQLTSLVSDAETVHGEAEFCGSFPRIRLLLPFKGKEKAFGEALCRQLIKTPPYDFRWLARVPATEIDLLVKVMSDSSFSGSLDVIQGDALFLEHSAEILAARGCIAYGLLCHALSSRYRVNYGLRDGPSRMAVPYAASDTPKLRAEYSHPVSIPVCRLSRLILSRQI